MQRSLADATPLPREFYNRDPRRVARELLGKLLVRRQAGTVLAGRIVETEAYLGEDDPAAHAAAGRTARNEVLFGPPGHAYVYLIYGNHFCLNVSCLGEGDAGCVLLRALEPVAGIEHMAARRQEKFARLRPADLRAISSGPGRLAQALGITRPRDNGKDLTSPDSDLLIVDDGYRRGRVLITPRVGITKAAAHPLRYVLAGSRFASVQPSASPRRRSGQAPPGA